MNAAKPPAPPRPEHREQFEQVTREQGELSRDTLKRDQRAHQLLSVALEQVATSNEFDANNEKRWLLMEKLARAMSTLTPKSRIADALEAIEDDADLDDDEADPKYEDVPESAEGVKAPSLRAPAIREAQ